MKTLLVSSILLLVVSSAYRLSESSNSVLQEKCGRRAMQRKVINGVEAKLGDHPWAISFYVQREKGVLLGPATIISPRHILAYNVVRYNASSNSYVVPNAFSVSGDIKCEGNHLVLPESVLGRFDVDYEHFTDINSKRTFKDTIAKIVVVNGCKTVKTTNSNLLIVEVKHNLIFDKNHRPACLSNSAEKWNSVNEFSMYGINGTGYLVHAQFSPVQCNEQAPLSCAKAINKDQGLCSGDFGGSATTYLNNQATVLGVYAKGNIRCESDTEKIVDYKFINVGTLRQEICEITGVCVTPPEEEVVTSTAVGDAVLATEETENTEAETVITTSYVPSNEAELAENTTEVIITTSYVPPDETEQTENATEVIITTSYVPSNETEQTENTTEVIITTSYVPSNETTSESSEEDSSSVESSEEGAILDQGRNDTLDVIVAENFDRLKLNITDPEVESIVANAFEKLKLGGSCEENHYEKSDEKTHEVHIHIHLNN